MIRVIDSTLGGEARNLNHSVYAISYLPSWLRLRYTFKWRTTVETLRSLAQMKEYFTSARVEERPLRAQRCLFVLRTLNLYSLTKSGQARYSSVSRELVEKHRAELASYLEDNPVVAWDWVVTWAEARALAEAFPDDFVRMFRRLRSKYDTKRKPKPELQYFINLLLQIAQEQMIDLERK